MNKYVEKFKQLTEREQILVLVSAVVVVIGLFYWVIWSPLNQALDTNQKSVEARIADLAWVKKNANRAIQLRQSSGTKSSFSGSLTQIVNQSAARAQIPISRMQPQGDELKIWVDEAPFNGVLDWLQALENSGVSILDVDIAQANTTGHIKIRNLKLGRS